MDTESTPIQTIDHFEIIDGLLYDKHRHKIITPFHVQFSSYKDDYPGLVARYHSWRTSAYKIFKYSCPNVYARNYNIKVKAFVEVQGEGEGDEVHYEDDRYNKACNRKSVVKITFPGNQNIYLYHEVPVADRPSGIEYTPLDLNYRAMEAPNALETIYHISRFVTLLTNAHLDVHFEMYRIELKEIMQFCMDYYFDHKAIFQLPPARRDAMRPETVMGEHLAGTLDLYMSYARRFYYYLLHMDKFADVVLDEEIMDKILILKSRMQDHKRENASDDKEKLKEKALLLQDVFTTIISTNNGVMFSLPIKAAMIEPIVFYVRNDPYCLKVMDAYKFVLKYLLIFNGEPPHVVSEFFLDTFSDDNKPEVMKTLYKVYNHVRDNCDFITNKITEVQGDGSVLVDGMVYSKEVISKFYKHLLSEYDTALKDLQDLGIMTFSIDTCFNRMHKQYKEKANQPFYCSFDNPEMMTHLTNINTVNDSNRKKIYKCLQDLTAAMAGLVMLSHGCTMRLFELFKMTSNDNDTHVALKKMRDNKYYVVISTVINKNVSLDRRVLFLNRLVSRYFVHYTLCIYPIKVALWRSHRVDEDVNNPYSLVDENSDIEIAEVAGLVMPHTRSTEVFLKTYVFVTCVQKNNEVFLHNNHLGRCASSMIKALGKGYTYSDLRQAMAHFNEEAERQIIRNNVDEIRAVRVVNSGHSHATALHNYAFEANTQIQRDPMYEATFEMMKLVNHDLGMEEDTRFGEVAEEDDDVIAARVNTGFTFSVNQLRSAKEELWPGMEFREDQEVVLNNVAGARSAVVSAPTGFGKSIIFCTILKAMEKDYPGLINIVMVPYTTLKLNMSERMTEMGFSVGSLRSLDFNLRNRQARSVYVGIYDDLKDLSLVFRRPDLGMVIFDEAHTVTEESSFREILHNISNYNVNKFKSILLFSATLPENTARDVYTALNIRSPFKYNNVILNYPHVGRVYLNTLLVGEAENISCYRTMEGLLNRFVDNYPEKKAVVFFNNKEKLERVGNRFGNCLKVSGDYSKADKEEIISRFIHEEAQQVLMGTKMISAGLDISQIALVIFYDYDRVDEVEYLQGIGRIRNAGVALVLSRFDFCGCALMRSFYNLDGGENCVDCCRSIPEEGEVRRMYDILTTRPSNLVQSIHTEVPSETLSNMNNNNNNNNNNSDNDSDDNIQDDYCFITAFETQPRREESSSDEDILEVLNNSVNNSSVGGRRSGNTSRREGDTSLEVVGETGDDSLESLNTPVNDSVRVVETVRVSSSEDEISQVGVLTNRSIISTDVDSTNNFSNSVPVGTGNANSLTGNGGEEEEEDEFSVDDEDVLRMLERTDRGRVEIMADSTRVEEVSRFGSRESNRRRGREEAEVTSRSSRRRLEGDNRFDVHPVARSLYNRLIERDDIVPLRYYKYYDRELFLPRFQVFADFVHHDPLFLCSLNEINYYIHGLVTFILRTEDDEFVPMILKLYYSVFVLNVTGKMGWDSIKNLRNSVDLDKLADKALMFFPQFHLIMNRYYSHCSVEYGDSNSSIDRWNSVLAKADQELDGKQIIEQIKTERFEGYEMFCAIRDKLSIASNKRFCKNCFGYHDSSWCAKAFGLGLGFFFQCWSEDKLDVFSDEGVLERVFKFPLFTVYLHFWLITGNACEIMAAEAMVS